MNETTGHAPEQATEIRMDQISKALERLERRDWWLWSLAVVVTLLLTFAVVSFSLPMLEKEHGFFTFNLDQAVRGLVGMILLFNVYIIHQQVLVKRLRRQLAKEIAMRAALRIRAEEFHKLATIDPLTGLYNSRFLDRRLAAEVNRCRRYSYPLTVLFLAINGLDDHLDSSVGERLLKEFAERLTRVIRISDVAVSMGGGKFFVLLPECRPEQVEILLERLRPLEQASGGQEGEIAFSAGWAGYQSGERPEELLKRAEGALRPHEWESRAV